MLKSNIDVSGLQKKFSLSASRTKQMIAIGLTNTAYEVQSAIEERISTVFDRPTDFVKNSVYVKQAVIQGNSITPAIVGIKGSTNGGVSPAHTLFAEIYGGLRSDRGSEMAFKQAGISPPGKTEWAPGQKAPLDAHGNISGGTIRQIMSALQANRGSGYDSNSRIHGISGLSKSQSSALLEAKKDVEWAKFLKHNDSNAVYSQLIRMQARQRLNDFKKRLASEEERFAEAKTKIKTWFVGSGKGKNNDSIVYQFDWRGRYNPRLHRTTFKKVNLRPVLAFTGQQKYRQRLPFEAIAVQVTADRMRAIFEEAAMRVYLKG